MSMFKKLKALHKKLSPTAALAGSKSAKSFLKKASNPLKGGILNAVVKGSKGRDLLKKPLIL